MSLTKIKQKVSFRRAAAFMGLSLLIMVKLTGVLSAQSVTRGYGSDDVLQRGMIVGLKKDDVNKVEALDYAQLTRILGVVVAQNDSPITVSNDNQRIFVASSGRYDVLVSDQQGAIGTNDYVTLSSLAGIGMKANSDQSDIAGRAVGQFDGKSGIIGTVQLADNKKQNRSVHIGRISVELAVGRNPLARNTNGAPAFLSRAGQAIAGKNVSPLRLYLSAVVFIVGSLIAGAVLYAGVRSSIIAIGRNPLGKRSILRSLTGVSITALFVFIVSIIAVYLLLKV